jgi:hypothetical protein
VSRQLLKQGKVPAASDFRPYQGLLATNDARQAQRDAAE